MSNGYQLYHRAPIPPKGSIPCPTGYTLALTTDKGWVCIPIVRGVVTPLTPTPDTAPVLLPNTPTPEAGWSRGRMGAVPMRCPAGWHWNFEIGRCVQNPAGYMPMRCPAGWHWNFEIGRCVQNPAGYMHRCPPGMHWDPSGECVPGRMGAPPPITQFTPPPEPSLPPAKLAPAPDTSKVMAKLAALDTQATAPIIPPIGNGYLLGPGKGTAKTVAEQYLSQGGAWRVFVNNLDAPQYMIVIEKGKTDQWTTPADPTDPSKPWWELSGPGGGIPWTWIAVGGVGLIALAAIARMGRR